MTNFMSHLSSRTRVGLLALVSVLGLFALLGFVPPDGLEHYKVAQFLGRFHLLLIHFPIALILLVPVLELAGRTSYFPEASSSVDFVLALATASAIVAS